MIFEMTSFIIFLLLGIYGVGGYILDGYMYFTNRAKQPMKQNNLFLVLGCLSLVACAWFADKLFK